MHFGIEHLYHDSEISNTYTALDAKEKLRTRQINAREGKQLSRYNQILERAHTVLAKRQNWEKNHIQQELNIIKLRSPSLDKSLKKEADAENNETTKLPSISTFRNSLVKSNSSNNSSHSDESSTHRSTSFRRKGNDKIDLRYSAEVQSLPPVETNTVSVYMRKANVVTRNLHRLYKRKRERTSYIRQAVEIIRVNNQGLLNEAKLYTQSKGKSDTDQYKQKTKSHSGEETIISEDGVVEETNIQKDDVDKETNNSKTDANLLFDIEIRDENNNENHDQNHLNTIETDDSGNNSKKNDTDKTIVPEIEYVSSTIVNPSDSSSIFDERNAKWTDIFIIPEMWKLFDSRKKVKQVTKPAPPALVTIRGKLRKTLLR